MWNARIIARTLFVLLAVGPFHFAQDAPTSAKNIISERHWAMVGLVRTINTIEVKELTDYGSYASWPILLAHHQEDFNGWLKRLL